MGLLIIDHSQGQGIDARQGVKQEYSTVACVHCGRIIAMLRRANDVYHLANVDIGRATPVAQNLSSDYVHHRRCRRCNKGICRICATAMEAAGGECPGPMEAKIENAIKTGTWDENYRHNYGQIV